MNSIKKIYYLLSKKEKKKAFIQLFLVLTMAFLEMLGAASILPFIGLLSNPELIETNLTLNKIYNFSNTFGVSTIEHFLFIFGILVFFLFVISVIIRAIVSYAQTRFALEREYSISKYLIEGYLHQPYVWFLNRHSADLGKSILSEVGTVVRGFLMPLMACISQIIVTFALVTLLILVDPILAFGVFFSFLSCYGIFFYLMKNHISKIGTERLDANTKRFTTVSEAFGAIKEIKLGGLENTYINRFIKPSQVFAKNQSLVAAIGHLPRYFLEGLAFGGMIVLILILMAKGSAFLNFVPLLALYAFAGYRLMPAFQQIYNSITQIRFAVPALDELYKDIKNLSYNKVHANETKKISLTQSIELKKIYFNYPNSGESVLSNLNLEIPAFNKIGIVGSTGSGKTTTVDLILGLLSPISGSLKVDGNIVGNTNLRAWQKNIGYVPQYIYLSDSSIASNIAFGVDDQDIDLNAVKQAAIIANLDEFIMKKLPMKYKTTIGERGIRLSGGQRQRIGIARALYHNPQLLVLDEATSALDNLTEQAIMEAVNNLGNKITIIIIAHRLITVKNCDKIFFLEAGKLKAEGTYDQLNQFNKEFRKMTGVSG